MTLKEIAVDYRKTDEMIKGRIRELQQQRKGTDDPALQISLDCRVRLLTSMHRDIRDIAVICERYYDKGYHRSERYTV